MSMTNAAETALLQLIFNNTAWLTLAAAGAASDLWLSLHTADPTETGTQTSNEAGYTSYARVSVARSGAGWTVSGNSATLTSAISFPACTGGSATITWFGIGTASSGAGNLILKGAVTPNISVTTGVTPQLSTGTTVSVD